MSAFVPGYAGYYVDSPTHTSWLGPDLGSQYSWQMPCVPSLLAKHRIALTALQYLQIIPLCFNLIIIRTSNIRENFGAVTIGLHTPQMAARFPPRQSTTIGTVSPHSLETCKADLDGASEIV
jgi:hypothetical protein